jgi:hypothetical protein
MSRTHVRRITVGLSEGIHTVAGRARSFNYNSLIVILTSLPVFVFFLYATGQKRVAAECAGDAGVIRI